VFILLLYNLVSTCVDFETVLCPSWMAVCTIYLGESFFFKQVQLAIRVRSFQYNTTKAYYKCTFTDGKCSLNIMFPNGNVAVLNSFGPEQVNLFIFTVMSLF
jgi:hypothetical protein